MKCLIPHTQPTPLLVPVASPDVYRMTVDEFERIADSLDDDHVELIDGYIVGSDELRPAHVLVTELLMRAVGPLLPVDRLLRDDKPVRIPDYDESRPDIAVVHGDIRVYANRHPGPDDISLLIEVSDSTLAKDQGKKLAIYARSGIAVYWIVNLVDNRIEVHDAPASGQYGRTDFGRGQ